MNSNAPVVIHPKNIGGDPEIPAVAICVATYRRPKGLTKLMESLKLLKIDAFHPHLIVADNDPNESARWVVEGFSHSMPFPVTYTVEPTRGIASVRNRLVREARARGAQYVAFVDDDETVDPLWLQLLVNAGLRADADVVSGRIEFMLMPNASKAMVKIFRAMSPSVASINKWLSTANLLLRTSTLARIDGPFDVRFNLTGGSDTWLGKQLHATGATFVHEENAITYETVGPSRANAQWLMKRAFRIGSNSSLMIRFADPSYPHLARWGYRSVEEVIIGVAQLVRILVSDRTLWLIPTQQICDGVGRITTLVFPRSAYKEYIKTHGE